MLHLPIDDLKETRVYHEVSSEIRNEAERALSSDQLGTLG